MKQSFVDNRRNFPSECEIKYKRIWISELNRVLPWTYTYEEIETLGHKQAHFRPRAVPARGSF